MGSPDKEGMRPTELLQDVRRSVSEILGSPFTEKIDHKAFRPNQKVLALWAADCAVRVLPYFEDRCPNDDRPRKAIEACRKWAATGEFKMAEIRKASLGAHDAARRVKEHDAIFAAHAAGQAVATAHVVTHALGSSVYGIRATAAHSANRYDGLIGERSWQLQRLRELLRTG